MEKEIGGVLKESRIRAGISVKQISTLLTAKGYKASEKTIYSWESGYSQPTPDALLEMCEAYGIHDILTTFGYDGYKKDGTIELNMREIELIEIYRSLDDLGKKNISLVLDLEQERTLKISEKEQTIHELYSYIEKLEYEKHQTSI